MLIHIIEDDKDLAEALQVKLEHEGFSVQVFYDGENGLKGALLKHPDLILLDIILPVINGLQVLSRLRGDKWGENAKILIITNSMNEERMDLAAKDRCDGYLIKSSMSLDDIVTKVRETIEKKNV